MDIQTSHIVRSIAGHDAGHYFYVMGTEDDFLLLSDGKRRRQEKPKRKRRKHVCFAAAYGHPIAQKIQRGESVQNSEIRRALAAFRDETAGSDFADAKVK